MHKPLFWRDWRVEKRSVRKAKGLTLRIRRPFVLEISGRGAFSNQSAQALLQQYEPWLIRQTTRIEQIDPLWWGLQKGQSEEIFPLLGEPHSLRIEESPKRRTVVELQAPFLVLKSPIGQNDEGQVLPLLSRFYKNLASPILIQRTRYWSHKMGLSPKSVVLKRLKAVWGSCTPDGRINLNWKIIVFPPQVIDDIIIHELAHLEHPHHQKSFWHLVGAFSKHQRKTLQWLKAHQHGASFLDQ